MLSLISFKFSLKQEKDLLALYTKCKGQTKDLHTGLIERRKFNLTEQHFNLAGTVKYLMRI